MCYGCGPVEQPDSIRTVAAIEIPLVKAADRSDLVAILRLHAAEDEQLHVDDVTSRWKEMEASSDIPIKERGTIFVGVWRGEDDEDNEAQLSDSGHPGKAWLDFAKGRLPERSTKFRELVLKDIRTRWPDAAPLPVLPHGGLPLREDLVMTADGYRIAESAAGGYELPTSSPLIAHK